MGNGSRRANSDFFTHDDPIGRTYRWPIATNRTGLALNAPQVSKHKTARPLPADLADVALLDIKDVCAVVRMSASWVHDATRTSRFPSPVIRQSRCARWRSADVRAWLIERIEKGVADTQACEQVTGRATKASAAAKAKRATVAAGQ
jgi:predicted DNA-binding transcriptional regulator AlpA